MIILVGIGCFILGGIVGVITMGLCVASHNSSLELESRQKEEMIDWMAIQIPKIQKAYKEAYCDE